MKKSDKVIAVVHFQDNGQDVQSFTIEFYPDFKYGTVIGSDMQQSIWKDYIVLSGKPKKGGYLSISKSPNDAVRKFKHKIIRVDFPAIPQPMELTSKVFTDAVNSLPPAKDYRPGYGMNVMVLDLNEFIVKEGDVVENTSAKPSPELKFEVRMNVEKYWHCLTPVLIKG